MIALAFVRWTHRNTTAIDARKTGARIENLFTVPTGEKGWTETHVIVGLGTAERVSASATVQARGTGALTQTSLTS